MRDLSARICPGAQINCNAFLDAPEHKMSMDYITATTIHRSHQTADRSKNSPWLLQPMCHLYSVIHPAYAIHQVSSHSQKVSVNG